MGLIESHCNSTAAACVIGVEEKQAKLYLLSLLLILYISW